MFISEITMLPSPLTSSTYDTWPRLYQPTAPTAGTSSTWCPRSLATLRQYCALPQWRPWYQLLNAIPLRCASLKATHETHCPWKKPTLSATHPPLPTFDSSQSGAAGHGYPKSAWAALVPGTPVQAGGSFGALSPGLPGAAQPVPAGSTSSTTSASSATARLTGPPPSNKRPRNAGAVTMVGRARAGPGANG